MASSAARIEANRRNAQKSTGPKTAEGKARSRANALTHGLTGSGTVIPADDVAKVEAMEAKLAADFPADNAMVTTLIRRFSVLSARLDRCADHDAAMTARRVRHAFTAHDNQRHDEVAVQAGRLAAEPFDAVRRLKQTPEGIDWLLGQWEEIRAELSDPAHDPADLADRAGMLLGLTPARTRLTAWGAWARSAAGRTEADDPERWVDAEVAALRELRDAVDDEIEAADRAEAPARALFDFGAEAERMRRYEAAAERHLFRTLRELHQARAMQNEPKPAPMPAPPPRVAAPPPRPSLPPLPPLPAPRSILDVLAGPARPPMPGLSDFINVSGSRPASSGDAKPKSARPKLH